jgi:hypothetical protein
MPLDERIKLASITLCQSAAWRFVFLMGLSGLAILIHGYHPYAEDAAIYVPAIKKLLDPSLYPRGAEFFLSYSHFSVFARCVALWVGLTHVSLPYTLLLWHAMTVGLLLAACWRFCGLCFESKTAPLYGTLLITAVLTLPVAGTSLLLTDPYLTSRSISTPLLLFAICGVLEDRLVRASLWLLCALLIHPLMAAYGAVFLLTLVGVRKHQWRLLALSGVAISAAVWVVVEHAKHVPVSPAYRAAVLTRSYFFLSQWAWYEVAGLIAPLGIVAWFLWARRRFPEDTLEWCGITVLLFGTFFFLMALIVVRTPEHIGVARYQPLRSFHLIYLMLFLLPMNAFVQFLFQRRILSFAVALAALSGAMFLVQRQSFPASAHIEWPWSPAHNPWQQAFEWVRVNTPKEAVFALDPDYMDQADEDHRGFRADAERTSLADRSKDGGVAAVFPGIADTWLEDVNATSGFQRVPGEAEALQLGRRGVTWIVTHRLSNSSLDCPYRNYSIAVCRLQPLPRSPVAHSAPAGILASPVK